MNEIIFFIYVTVLSLSSIIALKISKSALISLICLQAVLANLFVTKQIGLCGFTATASDALAVGCTLGLNLVQEYYNKEEAQKAVNISFFCLAVYTVLTILHLNYLPAQSDCSQSSFELILSSMPRIIIASLMSYYITQNLDCWLYSKLKLFNNFLVKNYLSVSITQLLDTVLFTFMGLYRINSQFESINIIYQIIFISYTIKLLTILISAPILTVFKKLIDK